MLFDLTGRVALVTGAGQNVGAGIARMLSAQGAYVAVNDVVPSRARALLREPDLPHRWQADELAEGLCVHCNKCMATIYGGTHCVLVAPQDRPGVRLRLRSTSS